MELLKSFGVILFTASATVACQVLAKYGLNRIGPLDFYGRPVATLFSVVTSPFIIGGLVIQALGFATWLTVLAKSNLTWAVGVSSALVFVMTAALNRIVLGEGINAVQTVGVALLCIGVLLLSYQGPL